MQIDFLHARHQAKPPASPEGLIRDHHRNPGLILVGDAALSSRKVSLSGCRVECHRGAPSAAGLQRMVPLMRQRQEGTMHWLRT
ncbi:MAG TPA: hypothetical protein VNV16_08835 [Methylibium sp.]|nr:hypothetical protein [Methylibium sp.]